MTLSDFFLFFKNKILLCDTRFHSVEDTKENFKENTITVKGIKNDLIIVLFVAVSVLF